MKIHDLIAYPIAEDRWVLMNVFLRTSIGLDGESLGIFSKLSDGKRNILQDTIRIWDVERFTNLDGLMADPSRFNRIEDWGEPRYLTEEEFIKELQSHKILLDETDAVYAERFGPKKSILDRKHFGNFHQQVGQELFFSGKRDPGEWWVEQKFQPDRKSVRTDNLYGAVQAEFLKKYFPSIIKPGMDVMDLGCGIGFYSNKMSECGANVLGIDPDPKYLKIASAQAASGVSFMQCQIGHAGGMDSVPDNSADIIYMSDALLFYYVPYSTDEDADIKILLKDIKRILKPNGVFVSMEPHSVFWLGPWLGEEKRPFTILTEYMHKSLGVTPSISRVIQDFTANGLVISNMLEVVPDADYDVDIDSRALHFARNFPVWQVFEARKSWPV